MKLIDGKKIAREIQQEIAEKVVQIHKRKPGLAFILVGNHPASQTYVRAKQKACASTGIVSTLRSFPSSIKQNELIEQIHLLNQDETIDGILVQLPLPLHIHEWAIMTAIAPEKDVDGFHPINMGKLLLGDESGFLPCTPNGIKTLLHRYHIPISGKKVVIVGRSNIVGKPLAAMLMQKKDDCNATVTVAHSKSEYLTEITREADILIAAVGSPHFINETMVRKGVVIIDVGINRLTDQTLVGDVDFQKIAPIASAITPVPGGVGPMTIAMLLKNTFISYTTSIPKAPKKTEL